MTVKTYMFTVMGRGKFPLDMLRYDKCHPIIEMDSMLMTHNQRMREINLISYNGSPTPARWKSYGWRVHNHH